MSNTPSKPNAHPSGTHLDSKLGRYECTQGSHNKFWECLYDSGSGSSASFITRWGRIGANKPQSKRISLYEAAPKIQEKLHKGYKYIQGSFKSLSEQQRSAITAELGDILAEKQEKEDSKANRRRM